MEKKRSPVFCRNLRCSWRQVVNLTAFCYLTRMIIDPGIE